MIIPAVADSARPEYRTAATARRCARRCSPERAGAAYLEAVSDGYIDDSLKVVASVTLKFETLRSEALTRSASRELILRRAEDHGPG
jgi:hypothetical protein